MKRPKTVPHPLHLISKMLKFLLQMLVSHHGKLLDLEKPISHHTLPLPVPYAPPYKLAFFGTFTYPRSGTSLTSSPLKVPCFFDSSTAFSVPFPSAFFCFSISSRVDMSLPRRPWVS